MLVILFLETEKRFAEDTSAGHLRLWRELDKAVHHLEG